MAAAFPDEPILTCSASATDDDYEKGETITNSAEETWLVPVHDTRDCDADLDKLTLKIMFMGRDLLALAYYYNYTCQPGDASAVISPEESGAMNTENKTSSCSRLLVSLEEADSNSNTCLLRAKVAEICSGNEQGLSDALQQFRIWDKESGDYREQERSTDSQGECTLQVPTGTWRVDVFASKDGYDEDWTNIYYCCGQGSEISTSTEDESPGQEDAQPRETVDISGRWNSSIGFVYDILQSGNSFTWQVVTPISKQGQGTITDEDQVTAKWNADNGRGSGYGTVEYSGSRIVRISWSNRVIFTQE